MGILHERKESRTRKVLVQPSITPSLKLTNLDIRDYWYHYDQGIESHDLNLDILISNLFIAQLQSKIDIVGARM